MSGCLREFLAAHPKADVRLEYLHPHRVYESVDSGQADIGLVSYPEESPSLAAITWRTEPMVLVCCPQHQFARRRRVSFDALNGEPFVAFQAGLKIREEIDRALALDRVAPKVALAFDNIETIKRAVEIGTGISLLPEPTIAREVESGTLVQVALEGEPLLRPLGIIHRRDRKLSDTAQQFIELLQSQAAPPTSERSNVERDLATNGRASESNTDGRPGDKEALTPKTEIQSAEPSKFQVASASR
jgi:DNA-binding transcriptional LysR family regulator